MQATAMSEAKELGRALRLIQDKIMAAPPGKDRDEAEMRFNRIVTRLKLVPDRAIAQWPFADDNEMRLVQDTEILWALSAFWDDET
jgi:hypothetical protein